MCQSLDTVLFKMELDILVLQCSESRDGTVVRALASHQCSLGLIPGFDIICGLSLFLVLVPAPRVNFSGYSGFPPSKETNISKFHFNLETVDK